jgi:peptide/nickel transport system permease protein
MARDNPSSLNLPLPSGEREKGSGMADTTATSVRIASPLGAVAELPVKSRSYWSGVLGKLRHDRVTLVCASILVLIVLSAIFAPLIVEADPYKTSMLRRLQAVGSPGHLLGTDELGRDMIARLIYGGRLSLLNGTLPVINALLIGGLLGVTAGFLGGRINMLIMRTIDVFYAFPSVLLAIAISGALGAGMTNAIVALTIVFIPPIARVSEAVTTSVRNLDFVEAARASGARSWTIIRVHILGNVLGPIFIYATGLISVAIILSSGLSFLGLGVKPPEPEWGLMLNTLRQSIWVNPVVAALPGTMIFMTSICFNLMSDGLRSAMDVKL